jgi:addiction module HigA family antidote
MATGEIVEVLEELLPLISPGEILRTDFLEPLGITAYRLAKDTGVQQTRITEILSGQRAITPDTAERLSRYFGTSMEFWLNLQKAYEVRKWRRERDEGQYSAIQRYRAAAG